MRAPPVPIMSKQGFEDQNKDQRCVMIHVMKRPPIARQAIEATVLALRRQKLDEEIAAYARANAGSHADLDPALEAAGLEFLHERWTARSRRRRRNTPDLSSHPER